MDIVTELNGVFQRVFEDDSIQIAREMTADDIEPWDSLSHVNLILAVENHFKIRFTQRELLTLRNVGDLIERIQSKIPI